MIFPKFPAKKYTLYIIPFIFFAEKSQVRKKWGSKKRLCFLIFYLSRLLRPLHIFQAQIVKSIEEFFRHFLSSVNTAKFSKFLCDFFGSVTLFHTPAPVAAQSSRIVHAGIIVQSQEILHLKNRQFCHATKGTSN